jgi:hypothetical protein
MPLNWPMGIYKTITLSHDSTVVVQVGGQLPLKPWASVQRNHARDHDTSVSTSYNMSLTSDEAFLMFNMSWGKVLPVGALSFIAFFHRLFTPQKNRNLILLLGSQYPRP